ncbi:MAG: S26 family signal peptidase [Dehalococcoidia bacterium]|nr:S26 family signal peptidase [Dehalococcoidia bacterium]|tara:strand:+ start:1227 stop:1517 length:291 start_codon:yes stop_codon:yes gene_type:complete
MTPALAHGDYVIADVFAYAQRPPVPGDVVLSRDPREKSRIIAKRVAVIGEEGAVILLGDNPEHSTDSRTFGPVPLSDVTGRIIWRYWPFYRFGPVR